MNAIHSNGLAWFLFQEIYILFTYGEAVHHESPVVKFYPIALAALQMTELACYICIYKAVSKHDEEMRQRKVISTDILQRRKQKNLLSMYAQITGFVLETMYLIFSICIKVIGMKFSLVNYREYMDVFYATQFGLNTTLQILVSSDLRLKFISLIRQIFHS